jgi:hypothetical protein
MSVVVNMLTQTGEKTGVPFDIQPIGELP